MKVFVVAVDDDFGNGVWLQIISECYVILLFELVLLYFGFYFILKR